MYEQWLHADLREVASQPCIPISVVDQQNTHINGRFPVQVYMYTCVLVALSWEFQLNRNEGGI